MSTWNARLRLDSRDRSRILVTGTDGDLLKARLPLPEHPRALLTLLEGLALWSGMTLDAAISAGDRWDPSHADTLFGTGRLDSALVRFRPTEPRGRHRIAGLGDFRQLYLLGGGR